MSRIARGAAGLSATVAVLMLVVSSPAHAGGPLPPDDPNASTGIPGSFVFLVVVGILISIGVAVWKVSTAQRLAKQSGMDPGLATQMTLLSDDGLDATYLAASLRQPPVPPIGDTSAFASAGTEVPAPPAP